MIDQQCEPALARLEVRLVHAAAARFFFPDQRELVLDALYVLRRQHWAPRDVAPLRMTAGRYRGREWSEFPEPAREAAGASR